MECGSQSGENENAGTDDGSDPEHGEVERAERAFERSLVLDPTSVLTLGLLAACYAQLGDTTRANGLYAKARSLSGGEFIIDKRDIY